MIQFVLSLASVPSIAVLALLVGSLLTRFYLAPPAMVIASSSRPFFLSPGDVFTPGAFDLLPGEMAGTEVTFRTRLGLPFALAWSALRRLGWKIVRGVVISTVAILAAIGIHILIGIAATLLTAPATPGPQGPIERSASWLTPAAGDDEALLRAQIVLLKSTSPTKGPAAVYRPLDVGAAIAEAMRRVATR